MFPHCLGYHDKESGKYNERLSLFLNQLSKLRDDSTRIMSALVKDLGCENTVAIYDACSGPNFSAVSALPSHLPSHITIQLVVSDADPTTLASLVKHSRSRTLTLKPVDVRYLDLCRLPITPPPQLINRFELISISLGLHQVDEQFYAIRYFLQLAKPNSYLIIPDVSSEGYYQVLLAPGNIIDREGYLKDMRQEDLEKLAIENTSKMVKLAYPLWMVTQNYPGDTHHKKIAMYSNQIFRTLTLPRKEFNHLKKLWDEKSFHSCDAFIKVVCALDIEKIQNNLLDTLKIALPRQRSRL